MSKRIAYQFAGHRYRVMLDIHHFNGSIEKAIFGWANEIDHEWLHRSSNGDSGWSNLRYEVVTDPTVEAHARSMAHALLALPLPPEYADMSKRRDQ